jgi:polysaccharide biosynthesis/export protein
LAKAGEEDMRILVKAAISLMAVAVASTAAWAADYRLRPGDKLEVTVWQDEKLNRTIFVAPDGRIAFPLVGRVQAGGRTVDAVESEIKAKLQKQYTDEIDVTVAVSELRKKDEKDTETAPLDPSIYVTGEVTRPGQYFFKSRTNVLQAIALAGGLGPFAAESRIKIRRKVNGRETLYEFDYGAFVEGEDLSGNMFLKSGDVIVVPEKGIFE